LRDGGRFGASPLPAAALFPHSGGTTRRFHSACEGDIASRDVYSAVKLLAGDGVLPSVMAVRLSYCDVLLTWLHVYYGGVWRRVAVVTCEMEYGVAALGSNVVWAACGVPVQRTARPSCGMAFAALPPPAGTGRPACATSAAVQQDWTGRHMWHPAPCFCHSAGAVCLPVPGCSVTALRVVPATARSRHAVWCTSRHDMLVLGRRGEGLSSRMQHLHRLATAMQNRRFITLSLYGALGRTDGSGQHADVDAVWRWTAAVLNMRCRLCFQTRVRCATFLPGWWLPFFMRSRRAKTFGFTNGRTRGFWHFVVCLRFGLIRAVTVDGFFTIHRRAGRRMTNGVPRGLFFKTRLDAGAAFTAFQPTPRAAGAVDVNKADGVAPSLRLLRWFRAAMRPAFAALSAGVRVFWRLRFWTAVCEQRRGFRRHPAARRFSAYCWCSSTWFAPPRGRCLSAYTWPWAPLRFWPAFTGFWLRLDMFITGAVEGGMAQSLPTTLPRPAVLLDFHPAGAFLAISSAPRVRSVTTSVLACCWRARCRVRFIAVP